MNYYKLVNHSFKMVASAALFPVQQLSFFTCVCHVFELLLLDCVIVCIVMNAVLCVGASSVA